MALSNVECMRIAIEEAIAGIRAGDGGPFGCVITKDGEVIAQGHNHVLADNDPTAHGEVYTIRLACERLGTHDLSGCVLYTSSEPCLMCSAAIAWANIDRVYYAATIYDANEILGFRDEELFEKVQENQRLTPALKVSVPERLDPFIEYKKMQGEIY